jgi:hypothetical protein
MDESQNPIDRLLEIIQRDGLTGLTEAEIGFFGIYWFVIETNNGSIDQFFFNDSGQLALPALDYLEKIGAEKTASILRRAIGLFPGGRIPIDQEERRELLLSLEGQDISFGPLTDELISCGEEVSDFHQEYVRVHPEFFARLRGETEA